VRHGEKVFFSEEKKQKTFMSLPRFSLEGDKGRSSTAPAAPLL
jgi:hypothetical protein